MHDPLRHFWCQHDVPRRGFLDRMQDRGRRDILEQVPRGAGFDRPEDLGIPIKRGENDHGRSGILGAQRGGRLHAVHAGAEAQVAQHDVGVQMRGECHRFFTGCRLPHNLDVIVALEEGTQPAPHDGVVVDQQHGDRH